MNYSLLLFSHWLLFLLNPNDTAGGTRPRFADREVARPRVDQFQLAAAEKTAYLASTLRLRYGQARRVQHCTYRHLRQLDSLTCPLTSAAVADSLLRNEAFVRGLAGEETHYYQALSRVLTPVQYEALLHLEASELAVVQASATRRQRLILRQ